MRESVKRRVRNALGKRGLTLHREIGADFPETPGVAINAVRPYTMTTVARIEAACSAAEDMVRNKIPGALVDSGWRSPSRPAPPIG